MVPGNTQTTTVSLEFERRWQRLQSLKDIQLPVARLQLMSPTADEITAEARCARKCSISRILEDTGCSGNAQPNETNIKCLLEPNMTREQVGTASQGAGDAALLGKAH